MHEGEPKNKPESKVDEANRAMSMLDTVLRAGNLSDEEYHTIRQDFLAGKITPQQVLELVERIEGNRQTDYH